MAKKILITAGGTGGHLFPALSLANELQLAGQKVFFAASGLSKNVYFKKAHFPYQDIRSATFNLKDGLKILPKFLDLASGIKESTRLLKHYQPHLVIGFGSYHTLPLVLAAKFLQIPFVLNEQNVESGKVNQLFKRYAKSFYSHYPLQDKTAKNEKNVSFPLRFSHDITMQAEEIKKKLGLNPHLKTLLIFGGSQGAQVLNQKVLQALPFFKTLKLQIIHLLGQSDVLFQYEKEYSEKLKGAYSLSVFEDRMNELYVAADFVVCRAGASTIHELIEFEKPALLVPYPYANHHQLANANFFVQQVKGGVKCLEKDLTTTHFCDLIQENCEVDRIQKYKEGFKEWKKNQKLPSLAEQILQEIHL